MNTLRYNSQLVFWSSTSKYCLKNLITLIVYFWWFFKKYYLRPFLIDFWLSSLIWRMFHNFWKIYNGSSGFLELNLTRNFFKVKPDIFLFRKLQKDASVAYFHYGPYSSSSCWFRARYMSTKKFFANQLVEGLGTIFG